MLYYNKDGINNPVIIIKCFSSEKKNFTLGYKLPTIGSHLEVNGSHYGVL